MADNVANRGRSGTMTVRAEVGSCLLSDSKARDTCMPLHVLCEQKSTKATCEQCCVISLL
jgi:hypothetical protein